MSAALARILALGAVLVLLLLGPSDAGAAPEGTLTFALHCGAIPGFYMAPFEDLRLRRP